MKKVNSYGLKQSILKSVKNKNAIMALVIIMVCVFFGIIFQFYHFLVNQIFEERKTHLNEISKQITQAVDISMQHLWSHTMTAGEILQDCELNEENDIYEAVTDINNTIAVDGITIIVCDGENNLYAPNRNENFYIEESLLKNNKEKQVLIGTGYDKTQGLDDLVFLAKLPQALKTNDGEIELTHIALVKSMSAFRKKFDITGFENEAYVYLVKKSGESFYENYSASVTDSGEDMYESIRNGRFLHNTSRSELMESVQNGMEYVAEFKADKQSFFVSTTPSKANGWSVIMFVPTSVLGYFTDVFTRTLLMYICAMAVAFIILVSGIVYMFADYWKKGIQITQHEEVKELLTQVARNAENASNAKSEFLSSMSHDIRTPINAVIGMVDIASKNVNDPERVSDCLKKISVSSEHLLSLINDVLDMSFIESGKAVVSRNHIDLDLLLNNCCSIIEGQLLNRDLNFIKRFDNIEYPRVIGDELRLRQVLINILGNAVKFTDDGGKIILEVKQLSKADTTVKYCFEITDTGKGMSEDFQQHIFEAFSQELNGSRTNYMGTGLGMSITKRFVDLMQGTIAVRSKLNEGSTFTIELEFEIDNTVVEEPQEEPVQVDLSGMHVLLVEDNELNLEIAQIMLEDEGVEVISARDGAVAVEMFKQSELNEYDAILMDIMMPVMNGLEAAEKIRSLERSDAAKIPIIAMTANAYAEDVKKTKEAGMNAHLTKPVKVAELVSVLNEIKG